MRPFAAGTAAACTTSTYVDGSEYVETLVGQVGDAVVREVEVAQLDEQTEVERHRADPVERHVEMLRYDTTRDTRCYFNRRSKADTSHAA